MKFNVVVLILMIAAASLSATFCLLVILDFLGMNLGGPTLVSDGKGLIYFFILLGVTVRLFYGVAVLYKKIKISRDNPA
jgi:hypothetical protein